jgi:hypothetical protein
MISKIAALSFFLLILSAVSVSSQTQVAVDPTTQDVVSTQQATVNINITNAVDLFGFQLSLSYDEMYIQDPVVTYNDFMGPGGSGGTVYCLGPDYLSGLISNYACTIKGASPGVSGDGDLVTVVFNTSLNDTSPVNIVTLKLSDNMSQNLSFEYFNGEVVVVECTGPRSCGSNVGACVEGTMQCVGGAYQSCQGGVGPSTEICNSLAGDDDDDNCNGIVNDVGGFDNVNDTQCGCYNDASPTSETCNNIDDDCNNNIDDGLNRYCNLTYYGVCGEGSETCSVGLWAGCQVPVANERMEPWCNDGDNDDCDEDEYDNPCGGDVSRDCIVDLGDLSLISLNFGEFSDDPTWVVDADPNRDGEVDLFDLVIVGSDFDSTYSNC